MLLLNAMNFFVVILILNSCYNSVLIDYFKYKYIKNVIVINCNSYQPLTEYKKLSYNGFHYSYCNVKGNCNINATKNTKIGLVLNSSCDGWFKIFHEGNYFQNSYHWIIVTEKLNETSQILSKYPVEIDSDVIIAHKESTQITFFETYNSGFYANGSFHVQKVIHWNNSRVRGNMDNSHKYRSRFDLTGVILKCVVVIPHPLDKETFENYVKNTKPTYMDPVHRIKFLRLLFHLQDIYKFSLKLIRTNSWGYLRNGSFDGLVGGLQRARADLGGSPLFMRADRAPHLDYTAQTWNSKQSFIFRHPKRWGSFQDVYTRPLSDLVWCCVCFTLVIIGVTLYFLMKRKSCSNEDTSLSLVILSVIGAVSQQGINIKRQSVAVRAVTFVTLVFTLTLFQYYNANVVSTLLHDPPKNIRTLKDLLQSPLKVGVEDVLYNKDYFKRTTVQDALELYKRKIANGDHPNFLTPDIGMALVKSGGYAFHVDLTTAYRIVKKTFTPREICELHEIQLYPPQNMVAVVAKGSPFRELITYGLRRMQEVGIYDRQMKVWDEPKPACVREPGDRLSAVTLGEFATALCVLTFGAIASLIILALEIMAFKLNRSKIVFTN